MSVISLCKASWSESISYFSQKNARAERPDAWPLRVQVGQVRHWDVRIVLANEITEQAPVSPGSRMSRMTPSKHSSFNISMALVPQSA
jgi:hypothetical protein